jgi:hypothetical protein
MIINLDCIACESRLPDKEIPTVEAFFQTSCQVCGTAMLVNFTEKGPTGPFWVTYKATDDRPEPDQDVDLYFLFQGNIEKNRFKRSQLVLE